MGPDMLKTHVTDREARISAKDVVDRWHELDRAGREAFLNGVRFTEMRGGALLAYLAESIEFDNDARDCRMARDGARRPGGRARGLHGEGGRCGAGAYGRGIVTSTATAAAPPPTTSRRERRKAETRRRLVDAAAEVIAAAGVEATT